jgi:hypothetical protein
VPALEATVIPVKYNFEQTFDRPVFTAKARVPVLNYQGGPQLDLTRKTIIYKEEVHFGGCPNPDFIHANKLTVSSHPIQWFQALHPDVSVWTTNTNFKVRIIANSGQAGHKYADYKIFRVAKIKQHLALYIINGLSPSPQVEMKFRS